MEATLISGLMPDRMEDGLIDLANRLNTLGHKATVYHWDQPIVPKAPIMIGHSLGFERCMKIIEANPLFEFEYVASIDGVTGAWFPFDFGAPGKVFTIPRQVMLADAFKRAWTLIDLIPWLSPPSSKFLNFSKDYVNFDGIKASHKDMPQHTFVTSRILSMASKLL